MLKYPETRYNWIASLSYLLKHRKSNKALTVPKSVIVKSLVTAIEDATEYLRISTDTFFNYVVLWSEIEERLFHNNNRNSLTFYESWKGQGAHYNICANIVNQHLDEISFMAINNLINSDKTKTVIDYGCGTASLSISFVKEGLIKGKVLLLDVDNDVKDFILFRLYKHKLTQCLIWQDVSKFVPANTCDVLYCIDVLEHLENPTDVFVNSIHRMLKTNGLLYLKAPWRGQLTHLDAAANNFYLGGGRKFLSHNYKLIHRFAANDIACIYRKIKE